MGDVQFDSESQFVPRVQSAETSGLLNLVITWGLAKDVAGAQRVLFTVLILAVVGIALVWVPSFFKSNNTASVPVVVPDVIR